MKENMTVYKDACVVRRKNRRIATRQLPEDSIGVELYNMVDKSKKNPKIVFAEVKRGRSQLCFKISEQGAKDLIIALYETLKLQRLK